MTHHNEIMPRPPRASRCPIRAAAERLAAERRYLGITNAELQQETARTSVAVGTVLSKMTREGKLHAGKVDGHLTRWFITAEVAQQYMAATAPKPKPTPTAAQQLVIKPPGLPAPVTLAPQPRVGEPIHTERTRYTRDTTQRPNSRLEAAPDLPDDPRWPRFAACRPGINPDTGKAWEPRA